ADVAPPLAKSEATSVTEAAQFLYEGEAAIQKGVPAGTMEREQVAVLRGRVTDRGGAGIAGVKVSVADHGDGAEEDFGHTATRADGGFDIAVNGGAPLTLVFERQGYIPAQRLVDAPWQDFIDVDPMVMVPYDGQETDVDTSGSASYSVAKGSPVTDGEGTRTATLLFEKGTETTMEVISGGRKSYQPVQDLDVRATEYTQDTKTSGLSAMPGQLPPNTAFTYAAEFSVDEAVAAGATDVQFSKPVVSYTDNFLDLPAGTLVPTGYYDREKEKWVGSRNGIVLEVLADDGAGAATFNLDADPAADPDLYAGWGIDDAERSRVSSLYEPGKQLWRVEIGHFTPWDYNMPYGPDGDSGAPGTGDPNGGSGDGGPGDCGQSGSLILCDSQVLGEMLPITGAGMDLVYRSDRVPGRTAERRVEIPLVEGELRSGVQTVELEIAVAGQTHTKSFTRAEVVGGKTAEVFVWDGKDAYGRR
ncbi:MAG: carboxypeptidase-like regulatory domain-containing protein, partial [Actinomycetes bacterium]